MRMVFFCLLAINLVLLGYWFSIEKKAATAMNSKEETQQPIVLVNHLSEAEIRNYDTEYALAKRLASKKTASEAVTESEAQDTPTVVAVVEEGEESTQTPVMSDTVAQVAQPDLKDRDSVLKEPVPEQSSEVIGPLGVEDSIQIIAKDTKQAQPEPREPDNSTFASNQSLTSSEVAKVNDAEPPEQQPIDTSTVPTGIEKALIAPEYCYTFENGLSKQAAQTITSLLQEYLSKHHSTPRMIEEPKAYKIIIPAQPDFQSAKMIAAKLNTAGIETYIPVKGALKNAILAGYFSNIENAEKRIAQLQQLDVVAEKFAVMKSVHGVDLWFTTPLTVGEITKKLEKETLTQDFRKKIKKIEINACQVK